MNAAPSKELIEQVSERTGIPSAYIEKDWYVTQVIRRIGDVKIEGFDIVFTGGTALAKAHGLLERFSEDVDFRLHAKTVVANRKNLSNIRKTVVAALRDGGFSFADDQVRSRDENRFFAIDIEYNSYFAKADALRPHIQVEVILRSTVLPTVTLPVSSFITKTAKQSAEVTSISCVDPVENAADKMSALAWRIPDRVRGSKFDDASIVRHIHDLALLKDKALSHNKFVSMVLASMNEDADRPKKEELAGQPPKERMDLTLKILSEDSVYASEYDLFVKGVSYAPADKMLSYDVALDAVRALARKVFA